MSILLNEYFDDYVLTSNLWWKEQVEYLFSDINLLANETMAKHISKEADGFGKRSFKTININIC